MRPIWEAEMPISASASASCGRLARDRRYQPEAVLGPVDARPPGTGVVSQAVDPFRLEAPATHGDVVLTRPHLFGDPTVGHPSAVSRMILALLANRCGVVWARTNRSSSSRSMAFTGKGVGPSTCGTSS